MQCIHVSDNKKHFLILNELGNIFPEKWKGRVGYDNVGFFKQFDTLLEIYDFITNLEKLEEKTKIKIEENIAKLKFIIPNASKKIGNNEIEIIMPEIKLKENDLILKLGEKYEKIDILEKKMLKLLI